jgi:hypothetical protein
MPARRQLPVAFWVALFALFVVPELIVAIETAFHFNGSAIDGPFQLYNALRRIAAGFRPGVDFQFFHGMGVPYAHYWLFRLLGGRFQDAEMAREVVAAVVFPASLLIFFRTFTHGWTRAMCASAGAMAAVYALRIPALLYALNSMVGLRSTLPTLAAVVLYRTTRDYTRVLGVGAMLGLSLFLSTEQGLAALLAYVIVAAIAIARRGDRRHEAIIALGTLVATFATLFVSLAIVGGFRGAVGALQYNFRFVPMDQYWFFGAPPNPFLSSWRSILPMMARNPTIGVAVLLGIGASLLYGRRLWRAARTADSRVEFALAFYAIYGLVSCAALLGVFVQAYSQTCWRVLICLALYELVERRVGSSASDTPQSTLLGVPRAAAIVALGVSALSFVVNRSLVPSLVTLVPHFFVDHAAGSRRFELQGIWPKTLQIDDSVVAAHRGPNGAPPTIWSTYAGWLEARAGVFHPSFDYAIHVLGPQNRVAYLEQFLSTRPQLVQTVRASYSQYEPWMENAHWDLYRELLRSYGIIAETPWSFIWARRATPLAEAAAYAVRAVADGSTEIHLPPVPADGASPITVIQVELEYHTRNPLGRLPVVGGMPRFLVGIEGAITPMPVSLDPYVTTYRFPLLARPGQTPILHVQPFSLLPGARIAVTNVRLSVIPVDSSSAAWLRDFGPRFGF